MRSCLLFNKFRMPGRAPVPLFLALFLACDSSSPGHPTSPPHEIVTIVSASIAAPAASALRQALAAPVYYLGRPEYPMHVTSGRPEDRRHHERAATLVLIGTTQPQDPTSQWIASLQGHEPVEVGSIELTGESIGYQTFENLTALGQTLVCLRVAARLDSLQLRQLGAAIRAKIEASQIRHKLQQLRAQTPTHELPELRARQGFRVALPTGYSWSDTSSAWSHSLEMIATHPTRILTVFWVDEAPASWATSHEFLLGLLRDALWRLHQDRLVADSLRWIVHQNGELSVQAVWQNPESVAGGPLQTRFVYDAKRQRLYGVQAMVFLPGADKHRVMREVLAVASTFSIGE